MKMVLVYDTENVEDLQNSIAIMRKLVSDYDQRYGLGGDKRRFARIQFIKILRQWEKEAAQSKKNGEGVATLRAVKEFTDNLWRENE